DVARGVFHQAADVENGVGLDVPEMLHDPALLPRHAHADHEELRLEGADPGEYLPAVLALPLRVEEAVRGLHLQSRMPRLEDASSPLAEPGRPGDTDQAPPSGARPIEQRMEPVDGRRAVPPRERN